MPACALTPTLALSKLQADVKTTSLEEMRVVMETYYEEVGAPAQSGVGSERGTGGCWLERPPGGLGSPSPMST